MLDPRRISEDFTAAPQIAPEDVATLKARGFALLVNNRPDGEEPGQPTNADMRAAAEAAGLAYRAIPVTGGFSGEQVQAMAQALAIAEGPVFAFCRSGTRSTLLWALAQASAGGDPERIAAAAAAGGYDIAPMRAAVERLAATS